MTDVKDDLDQDLNSEYDPSRLHLIWEVVIFQFKLSLDGLRDLVLMPISLVSALLGLLAGGSEPAKYYNKVLRFGRRTEIWINLFGQRAHQGTSDELIKPLRQKLFRRVEQKSNS